MITTEHQCYNRDETFSKVTLFHIDGDKKPCENLFQSLLAGIYLFKDSGGNRRTVCEICSKLAIKTPERHLIQCCNYLTFCI